MKSLNKYISRMSDWRFMECSIVLELVKMGVNPKEVKSLVKNSGIKKFSEEHPMSFFHKDPEYWAREILEK